MKITFLPAFHGDCIIVSYVHEDIQRNILIDGGPPRTYPRVLKPALEKITSDKQNIDLLIVTHIDDDHIGGIKKLFEDTKLDRSFIKRVWFNSGNLLFEKFEKTVNLEREVAIIPDDTVDMSINQGITLEKFLLKEGSWIKSIVDINFSDNPLPNVKITILSPSENGLIKLHQNWQVEVDNQTNMSADVHSDYNVSISDLAKQEFKEDQSIPNGSSIAFLLELEDEKVLFLADSHPSVGGITPFGLCLSPHFIPPE